MDVSSSNMCATNALASFHKKIKEAIALVRSMSTEDKLKAVQCWNMVSENLQDVVNSSADDISALQSRLCERENKILLQNAWCARLHKNGVPSRQQAPNSQSLTVVRRTKSNADPDLGNRQHGTAAIGPGVIDRYLGSPPPVAITHGGRRTAPVSIDEYDGSDTSEMIDDPLTEQATSPGLINDLLGAEGAIEHERSEPVSREIEPPSTPPGDSAGKGSSHSEGVTEAAASTPHISDVPNDADTETMENDKPSENAELQRCLSFTKNETGTVVLNVFTREQKCTDISDKNVHQCSVVQDNVYRCNVCQKIYPSLAAFSSHFAVHCEQLMCCKCGRTCKSKTLFRAHMLTHSKSLLECIHCGRAFSTFSNLSRHMKTHTGERRHQCSVCQKRFAERKDLRTHSRLHSGERPYRCNQCPARFIQLGALSAHLRHHSGERPHLCDLCGKAFAQMAQLNDHKLRHEGKKCFLCDLCPMAFNVRGDLKRHKHSHLSEKPHKCSRCSKSFARLEALEEHLNRHSGRRPYRCTVCDRSYADRSARRKHMKTHVASSPASPASPAAGPPAPPVIQSAADTGA